jgi:hypothetical protein
VSLQRRQAELARSKEFIYELKSRAEKKLNDAKVADAGTLGVAGR